MPIAKRPSGVVRRPAGLCMKRPYGAIMPKKGEARALTRQPQRRTKVPYGSTEREANEGDQVVRESQVLHEGLWRPTHRQAQTVWRFLLLGAMPISHHQGWGGTVSITLGVLLEVVKRESPGHTVIRSYEWSCFSRPPHAGFDPSWYHIGVIKRGCPESLWISRLPDRLSSLKAPGPGPIQRKVWHDIAKDKIDDKGVILHSDSARSYMKEYKRMVHTHVVHCKKWKNVKWTKPFFSKHVKAQCGKRQKVVRQIIDGIWRLLRKGKWGGHGSKHDLESAVRWVHPVQWKYWFQGQDLFCCLGSTFKTTYWLG